MIILFERAGNPFWGRTCEEVPLAARASAFGRRQTPAKRFEVGTGAFLKLRERIMREPATAELDLVAVA